MTQSETYRQAFPNKTDDQIIESLAYELKDKVETIHQLLESISIKDQYITGIKSGFELLLEDYKRRLVTISDIILSTGNNRGENDIKKMERLKTKQSEYRTFICELERTLIIK